MDKEKQQKAIFIVLFFFGVLFGVYYFLLSPLYEDIEAKEAQKEVLTSRLNKSKKLIRDKKKVMAQFELNKEALNLRLENMPLPRNDEQSWLVNEFATLPKNLHIEWSTDYLGSSYSYGSKSRKPLKKGQKPKLLVLEDYSFEIDLICGFHDFGKTIAWFEQKNPCNFVEEFSCSLEREGKGRNLSISIKLAYPRFTKMAEEKLNTMFEKEK